MPAQQPTGAPGTAAPAIDVFHVSDRGVRRTRCAQAFDDLLGEALDADGLEIHYDHDR